MLSRLAIKIKDYAKQGMKWLETNLFDENEEVIYIRGLCFSRAQLQTALESLEAVVLAKSDEELDRCINEEIIPLGLLYKEPFWIEFQSFIDIWCGEYSDLLRKNTALDSFTICSIDVDNTLYIKMETIYHFQYNQYEVIIATERSDWMTENYDKEIRIFKYNKAMLEIREVLAKEEYIDLLRYALQEIGKAGCEGDELEEVSCAILLAKKKCEQCLNNTKKKEEREKIIESITQKVAALLPDLKTALAYYSGKDEICIGGVNISRQEAEHICHELENALKE